MGLTCLFFCREKEREVTEGGVHEYPWGQFAAGVVGCKRVKSQKIDIPFEAIQNAVAHAKEREPSLHPRKVDAAPSMVLDAKRPDLLPKEKGAYMQKEEAQII